MLIPKDEVISRLCSVLTSVNNRKYNWTIPTDCFCDAKGTDYSNFQFDEEVLKYVEDCVYRSLSNEN